MTIEEIRAAWKKPPRNPEHEKNLWNSQADDHVYVDVPSFETSGFLRLLERENMLDKSYDVLDIGCGAGVYSVAISDRVRSAKGYDIAAGMLDNGRRIIRQRQIKNVTLEQGDWRDMDIKALGLESRFDLVLVHTTPAVCDLETFEKMLAAGRGYCVISFFTRPNQPIMQTAHEIAGVKLSAGGPEKSMAYILDYLLQEGYEPGIFYEKLEYSMVQKLEDSYEYYLDRICAQKKLSTEEEAKIKDYIASTAVNGIVTEKMDPTIITIYWDKRQVNSAFM